MSRKDWNALALRTVSLWFAFTSLSNLKWDIVFVRRSDTVVPEMIKGWAVFLIGWVFAGLLWFFSEALAARIDSGVPAAGPEVSDAIGLQNAVTAGVGLAFAFLAGYNLIEVCLFACANPLSGWEIPRAGVDLAILCLGIVVIARAPVITNVARAAWSKLGDKRS